MSEFMKRFPGGIPEWIEWRRKGQKDRNLMWSDKKVVNSHFIPVGPDNTEDFEDEPPLWSGDGFENFESIKDYLKSQDANDHESAALKAIKDFINYWKLLQKSKKRRKGKYGKK